MRTRHFFSANNALGCVTTKVSGGPNGKSHSETRLEINGRWDRTGTPPAHTLYSQNDMGMFHDLACSWIDVAPLHQPLSGRLRSMLRRWLLSSARQPRKPHGCSTSVRQVPLLQRRGGRVKEEVKVTSLSGARPVPNCLIQIASGCTLVSVLLHGPTSYDCPRTDSSPRPATF